MTQPPPPPPSQPPQGGGFGAPQDQPPQQPQQQPGFGAPQTPPAPAPQPGYGYPQAPQPPQGAPATPPAPQGPPQPPQSGYGYPGGQPGPYGGAPGTPGPYGGPNTPPGPYGAPGTPPPGPYGQQPSAYGQQPGYGFPPPTAPLQPQAATPAGGGRRINPQLAIIVAAVVAIALIVGGGVWYASSGKDDDKTNTASSGGTGGGDDKGGSGGSGGTSSKGSEKVPANPASTVLFQVPMPKVAKDDSVVVEGSWLTDEVYAKSGVAEIVGYDVDKGTKTWSIKLPGPVCHASRHATEDGRTAVVFQPKMPAKNSSEGCSQVAAIDLAAGKKLWQKTAMSGDRPISFDNITVSANTVAVGSTSGGAAFDLTTGESLWSPKPTDTCYDAGYGGGAKLVAVRKCGQYGARQLHIQTIDPKSGKVISEYKMTQGIEYASVVSTDPLVVAADVGDAAGDGSGISDFFSVDNKTGQLRTRISAPGDDYAAKCDGISRIEDCSGIAVGNDRLYLPTEEHDSTGEYGSTNEIVVFDLATGKQTGQRGDAGDGYTITPLRMDGGNVIAYKSPPYDKGGQVVSLDGGSFKETKLLENPSDETVRGVETSMLPDYAELLYSQGRLYMSETFASSSSYSDEYLAIAFGATG
ncbi:PQQ-binding-like beta-propeller repeat protein [Streptomyces sp.]|uniref:outer membrane protein assembly factor BamB family protein n=1 Tax=Streptomyces sp. TaxID=1931 RepID=UPI002D3D57FF|nr:PQQ-binding-like beta-propeller repeat protein [Streptomyces sp.]HZF91243.1 PQQ-binding-like beta-propeller repeat protein [Streptomyces sp.]